MVGSRSFHWCLREVKNAAGNAIQAARNSLPGQGSPIRTNPDRRRKGDAVEEAPAAEPAFLQAPRPNIFFTGKGGVGKTTCATATALKLARAGRRVLLVSTDPASNLDQVLGLSLGLAPTAVPSVPGLRAMNLDPEQAAAGYRERMVAPARGVLPESLVRSMEEQLSGACTVEIATFDLFAGLLAGAARPDETDVVIFDTAPTGHTLRLLALPAAWEDFLQTNTTGNTCLGPLQGLREKQALYAEAVRLLSCADLSEVILVARPQAASLREAERTRGELTDLGVSRLHLILNGTMASGTDPIASKWAARGREAVAGMAGALAALPRTAVPLTAAAFHGIDGLDRFFSGSGSPLPEPERDATFATNSWEELLEEVAQRPRGLVMAMGKGGVGKTILAAKMAEAMAGRGLSVVLATTDPAGHAADACSNAKIEVIQIDAAAETEAYRSEVLASAGAGLDPEGRALLEEDLRSPCTEEIAVFRAFARIVERGVDGLVICDTAPTGHTLLLLDATQAYHRELGRQTTAGVPAAVLQLLPRLRDPAFNRVLVVTLPEATPVHEAGALERDLERAGIRPFAWIVNQSLSITPTRDPLLLAKAKQEHPWLRKVLDRPSPAYVLPWREDFLY